MTFSEYITNNAWKDYLQYCAQHNILPVVDTDLKPKKICALCKPKTNDKKISQTRTAAES